MKQSLIALCLFALTGVAAHAEVIKLKVDVAYDRCQTIDGRKSCTVTAPIPRDVVEINYNGGTMGKWSTQIVEDGVVLDEHRRLGDRREVLLPGDGRALSGRSSRGLRSRCPGKRAREVSGRPQ